MKRLALVLMMLLAATLAAQDTVRKVVEVKYANANALSNLVSNLGGKAYADNQLKAIVLSGTPDFAAKAEEAIRQLLSLIHI